MDSFVLLYTVLSNYTLYATQLYATLLLPNGIKLFETDSLLNIGIHRYTNFIKTLTKFEKRTIKMARTVQLQAWRVHYPINAQAADSQSHSRILL